MTRYVAFDVETPNRMNNRMSAIGISVIEDGKIADEYYSLVNPESQFDSFNTRLTGISDAPDRDQRGNGAECACFSGSLEADRTHDV